MPIAYENHGGIHHVTIAHMPAVCHDRLVHLSQDAQQSWVIRDYVTGQQLRRSPPPNPSSSTCDLAQIEAQIIWSESPPFHAWENHTDWEAYLRLRSLAVIGRLETTPPVTAYGSWQGL